MENKKGLDSVTILCILAILLLVVLMVLPPMLRLMEDDEEPVPTPTPEEKTALTIDSFNSISNNGIVDCSKDGKVSTIYYKDEIVYQVQEAVTYERATENDISSCSQKVDLYKNTEGIVGLCEYDNGKFVATFIYNFNELTSATTGLPMEKNSNIKDVLRKYIEENNTCYMK